MRAASGGAAFVARALPAAGARRVLRRRGAIAPVTRAQAKCTFIPADAGAQVLPFPSTRFRFAPLSRVIDALRAASGGSVQRAAFQLPRDRREQKLDAQLAATDRGQSSRYKTSVRRGDQRIRYPREWHQTHVAGTGHGQSPRDTARARRAHLSD